MKTSEITSPANPRVKGWASLARKKGRDTYGQFLVEGPHLVTEALCSGAKVHCVVYDRDRGLPAEVKQAAEGRTDLEWVAVTPEIVAKCCDTVQPQGVFAVVGVEDADAGRLIGKPDALVIAADGVQDPGNLGTIIRSADAAGADGVVIGRGSADVYNPKTVRSTMGSLFHLPIAAEADLPAVLRKAREHGAQVVAASVDAEDNLYDLDCRRPTWFVVGSEAHGLSAEVLASVNRFVKIPMRGAAESLNVAMAATLLLYEALRQREFASKQD